MNRDIGQRHTFTLRSQHCLFYSKAHEHLWLSAIKTGLSHLLTRSLLNIRTFRLFIGIASKRDWHTICTPS